MSGKKPNLHPLAFYTEEITSPEIESALPWKAAAKLDISTSYSACGATGEEVMELILTNIHEAHVLIQYLRRRCTLQLIPLEEMLRRIISPTRDSLLVDGIVCFDEGKLDPLILDRIVSTLRRLPVSSAMTDGRTWNRIPFILVSSHYRPRWNQQLTELQMDTIYYSADRKDYLFEHIRSAVSGYWEKVFAELDNLGFEVYGDHGRYRLRRPAKHREEIIGKYYYGPRDIRSSTDRLITATRNLSGIEYELGQFEALLNKPDVTEPELQDFFEENPHFLAAIKPCQPFPHVRLKDWAGEDRIPDFVLRPNITPQRDSNWEVLELKLPQAKLLARRRKQHVHFSQEAIGAIAQAKDYGECFKNPANSGRILESLGHKLMYPQLAILIGRLPKQADIEQLELAQSREPYVRVRTYDEILEFQMNLLG